MLEAAQTFKATILEVPDIARAMLPLVRHFQSAGEAVAATVVPAEVIDEHFQTTVRPSWLGREVLSVIAFDLLEGRGQKLSLQTLVNDAIEYSVDKGWLHYPSDDRIFIGLTTLGHDLLRPEKEEVIHLLASDELQGVSFLDAALVLNNDDSETAHQAIDRWKNRHAFKTLANIGSDPSDARRQLYDCRVLTDFIEKADKYLPIDKHLLLQRLKALSRAPQSTDTGK